ncbi:MAG: hypothetical protein GX470_07695 [Lentimicrobium sp.]|jgi:hypothetical protein|nr:hypothetical protein [Lentimicrobium sp.]
MKTAYKYQLQPGSKKHLCPACGKRRFVRYIDKETGELLPERFGRCDREINCGYNLNPYKAGYLTNTEQNTWNPPPPPKPQPSSYINPELFRQSLKNYNQNNFTTWLTSLLDLATVNELVSRYHIGTSKHWPGATVFWQIDQNGLIHSGKIMLYNQYDGKRIKEPYNHINWVHKVANLQNFNLSQCYFGEHLLAFNPTKPIALVESEKTAIIASVYLPQFNWLAVGSLNNLSIEKFRPLAGRKIALWPDLNCFGKWSQKATELQKEYPRTSITVSDLLEKKCTFIERQKGFDLADFLTNFNPRLFQEHKKTLPELIREQWQGLNQKNWIISPIKYPTITRYNLEILTEDLNRKNGLNITPNQYLQEFLKLN